jgi:uncharacterized protein with von Willebrand factor type A (vWA) domain
MANLNPTHKPNISSPLSTRQASTTSTSLEEARQRFSHAFAAVEHEFRPTDTSHRSSSPSTLTSSTSLEEAQQRFENALAKVEKEVTSSDALRRPSTHQNTMPPSTTLEEAKQRFECSCEGRTGLPRRLITQQNGEEKRGQISLLRKRILRLEDELTA